MITGDNQCTAEAFARRLNIDEVVVVVLPDAKVATLRQLKARGRVAFMRDGINETRRRPKRTPGWASAPARAWPARQRTWC
jgi:high-affinity K+ transport system ATPase subunit B